MNKHLLFFRFIFSFFLKNSFLKCAFSALFISLSVFAQAQITIKVTSIPENTPDSARLFIAGSFVDWDAGHPAFALKRDENGVYSVTLPDTITHFEYKFTRGTWLSVEADQIGKSIPNRKFQADGQVATTLSHQIKSWQDLAGDPVTFVLEQMPENTPHDASFYVSGNFNGWLAGHQDYRLKMQPDSTFSITLPVKHDTIKYKFTRGNWPSVEGRENGLAMANRVFVRTGKPSPVIVRATVESWEDLAGSLFSVYNFVLLLAAFQGLFLILAIIGLQRHNLHANRQLAFLILIISVTLVARAVQFNREIFNAFPRIYMIPDLIYFSYGPLFLFYMRELLTEQLDRPLKRWLHFLPLLLMLAFYLPMIVEEKQSFIDNIVDKDHEWRFLLVGAIGALYNMVYWYRCHRLLYSYSHNYAKTQSEEQNLYYMRGVLGIQAICLIVWVAALLVGAFGTFTGWTYTPVTDFLTDTVWLVFAFTTFFMGYFAMTQPEIFRLKEEEIGGKTEAGPEEEKGPEELPEECKELIDGKLDAVMRSEKPYKDPQLSLSKLAQIADSKPHILSKAINEGYQMNFYDYVNGYRVEEFKRLLEIKEYQNHTFLAIALEVGFNSKTAFNRAFKKMTGLTPRQYFNDLKERLGIAQNV